MVDQVANFKKITVSTGYDDAAVSIVLEAGQGAELPDPSGDNYNLVWWDSTNYPDPADDPNVEIVRVTAKSTDTLTVTRNQEGSGASTKNTGSATYLMILSITANTITDLIADVERTATVIVGKSGYVDYLTTDYGSDNACIQAAIDYVNGLGGGDVVIREGTYDITASIIIKDYVWLHGVGKRTILASSITDTGKDIIDSDGTTSSKEYFYISDMKIEGSGTERNAVFLDVISDSIVRYLHISGMNNNGIFISTAARCSILGCYIDATVGDRGIYVDGANEDISVINNTVENATLCGIECDDVSTAHPERIKIIGNTVRNTSSYGILVESTIDSIVSNNTVDNCGATGMAAIGVTKDDVDTKNISVIGNVILNTPASTPAIKLSTCSNVLCEGNIVDTGLNNGINIVTASDIIISNNSLKNITSLGVYTQLVCDNIQISNNNIDGGTQGIVTSGTPTDFNISGNIVTGCSERGLKIDSVSRAAISNNVIKNCVQGISGSTIIHASICNNVIEGNTNGVNCDYCTYSNIQSNIFDNNSNNAYAMGSNSSYVSVINNQFGGDSTSNSATNSLMINNIGYNPVGAVGPPSVPATTVNYSNAYGYPCQVQVYGGTVTEIDIDDIATGLTGGIFMIPPGGTINITYSAAPSWRWWGL